MRRMIPEASRSRRREERRREERRRGEEEDTPTISSRIGAGSSPTSYFQAEKRRIKGKEGKGKERKGRGYEGMVYVIADIIG